MKLKSLLVIAVLVIGCGFASAQSFGFGTAGGVYLYCNYEVLQQLAPYTVWQGSDILTTCGLSYNAVIVGISGGMTAPQDPIGVAIKGVTYADNIYDAASLYYTGAQWDVTTNLKCNKYKCKKGVCTYSGKYGWIGFAGVSEVIFGDNYGYLSCTLPGKEGSAPTRGFSTGSAKAPTRK